MTPFPARDNIQQSISAKDRLIVALNTRTIDDARKLVRQLQGSVTFYKIGLQLQLAPECLTFVQELIDQNHRVFLDYKYLDIEDTVQYAVERAAEMGVSFLTIHGNGPTMKAAIEGRGRTNLKILVVTVLTSLDADDMRDLGLNRPVEELVLHRAQKAIDAGCDGVIASGEEAQRIRQLAGERPLLIVTPGIRQSDAGVDDHKRATTPSAAIAAGADYLVVGRPIINDPDPKLAAEKYLSEMQEAFDARLQRNS
jgi:orotidine-5'-phosphate decarboxylase